LLSTVASHEQDLTLAMLLGLLSEVFSIFMACMLLPLFRKYHEGLAFAFLAFGIAGLLAVADDNSNLASLLALGLEFAKKGANNPESFHTLANIACQTREWTHLMSLLISGLSLPVLSTILILSNLVPKFLAIWGLIASLLMIVGIVLMILGINLFFLLIPLALHQLFFAFWLMLKGFRVQALK